MWHRPILCMGNAGNCRRVMWLIICVLTGLPSPTGTFLGILGNVQYDTVFGIAPYTYNGFEFYSLRCIAWYVQTSCTSTKYVYGLQQFMEDLEEKEKKIVVTVLILRNREQCKNWQDIVHEPWQQYEQKGEKEVGKNSSRAWRSILFLVLRQCS